MRSRHEVQMEARAKAHSLGHRLGPFEESSLTGKRLAHCSRTPTHWVRLSDDVKQGWVAEGPGVTVPCGMLW